MHKVNHLTTWLFVILATISMVFQTGCRQGNQQGNSAAASGPSGVLTGKFKTGGSNQISHGTWVYLEGLDKVARTSMDGSFRFEGLQAGKYTVLAERDKYRPVRKPDIPVEDGKVTDIGIVMLEVALDDSKDSNTPNESTLSGWALYTDRMTHDGIKLRVEDNPSRWAYTDPDGGFFLDGLDVGPTTILVMAAGYQTYRLEMDIKPGLNAFREDEPIILNPTGFNSQVLDPATRAEAALANQPEMVAEGEERILGAVVPVDTPEELFEQLFEDVAIVVRGGEIEMYSGVNASGNFEFKGLAVGEYELDLESDQLLLNIPQKVTLERQRNARILLEPTPTVDVEAMLAARRENQAAGFVPVSLTGTGSITGRLALAKPEQLPSARITIMGTAVSISPDPTGAFTLSELGPGLVNLAFSASGHKSLGPLAIDLGEGERKDIGVIELKQNIDAPKVVGVIPAPGTRGVSVDETVIMQIEFDQPMVSLSVKKAFSIEPDVSYRLNMGGDRRNSSSNVLTVELYGTRASKPLKFNEQYRVTIASSAQSVEGVQMESAYSTTFTTALPELIETYPADGSTEEMVNMTNPVVLYMNSQIDDARDFARAFRISPREGGTPIVKLIHDRETGWGVVELFYPFQLDTKYTVRVEPRFRTLDGDKFSNLPYTFRFTTPDFEWTGDTSAFSVQRPRGRSRSPRR